MKKRIALLWAVIIAALLAGTGLGLPWLVRWMNGGQLFSADTMLSLYVAVYTLEATLVIAVLIYSLQTGAADREARRRARSARRILYTELSQGLDALVRFSGSGGGNCGLLSELFLTYLPDIQGLFTPQQLHHLIQVIDALVGVSRLSVTDAEEAAGHAGGSLLLVIQPQYYSAMRGPFSYRFSSLSDYRTALNPITREILEILSGQPLPEAGGTVLRTTTGQPLLDTSGYPRVRMYDEDGGLLCDAELDSDSTDLRGVESGWARLRDYEGTFQDGLRHGTGCSYSTVYHHKLFAGSWKRGDPLEGVQYDCVTERRPDGDYTLLFPYWSEWSLVPSHICDYLIQEDPTPKLDDLYVCDLSGPVDGERWEERNVRPLLDFVRQEDPGQLDSMLDAIRAAEAYHEPFSQGGDPDQQESDDL